MSWASDGALAPSVQLIAQSDVVALALYGSFEHRAGASPSMIEQAERVRAFFFKKPATGYLPSPAVSGCNR